MSDVAGAVFCSGRVSAGRRTVQALRSGWDGVCARAPSASCHKYTPCVIQDTLGLNPVLPRLFGLKPNCLLKAFAGLLLGGGVRSSLSRGRLPWAHWRPR